MYVCVCDIIYVCNVHEALCIDIYEAVCVYVCVFDIYLCVSISGKGAKAWVGGWT